MKQATKKINVKNSLNHENVQDGCSICLETINEPTQPNLCNHVFCLKCIYEWTLTNETCPLCRHFYYGIKIKRINKILPVFKDDEEEQFIFLVIYFLLKR